MGSETSIQSSDLSEKESCSLPDGAKLASPDRDNRYYRPELDWLRFFAFLMVFLCHACPKDLIYTTADGPIVIQICAQILTGFVFAGFHGVDLFFVLSAFLITELLLRERDSHGKINVKWFYLRRILRIWPLYFVFIAIWLPFDARLIQTEYTFAPSLILFVYNWHEVFFPTHSLLGHLWTVSVEEQFYLVWPLFVRFAKPRRLLSLMVVIYLVSFAYRTICLAVFGVSLSESVTMAGMPLRDSFMRMDCFALGGIAAIVLHNRQWRLAPQTRALGIAFFAVALWLVGTAYSLENSVATYVWTYPLIGLASFTLTVSFASMRIGQALSLPLRALCYSGKISYGLYVWHLPVIWVSAAALANSNLPTHWLAFCTITLAATLTFALSMISYAILEKPFLRLKRRFTIVESRPV